MPASSRSSFTPVCVEDTSATVDVRCCADFTFFVRTTASKLLTPATEISAPTTTLVTQTTNNAVYNGCYRNRWKARTTSFEVLPSTDEPKHLDYEGYKEAARLAARGFGGSSSLKAALFPVLRSACCLTLCRPR
jgi:hypothetical protein